jgi:hypothetical protein
MPNGGTDMNAAEILAEYRRALAYSIAYFGTAGNNLDQRIMDKLIVADQKVRKHELVGTAEYAQAVMDAERDANSFRASKNLIH